MKKHLALFSMLLALGLMTSTAFAQDATTAAPATTAPAARKSKASGVKKTSGRADSKLADLSTSLNLTDDQKAKVKPIIDDEEAKMHVVKKDSTMSKDDQKTKTEAIRTDANRQIRALLTPDQQKTFDASSRKGGGKKKDTAPAA